MSWPSQISPSELEKTETTRGLLVDAARMADWAKRKSPTRITAAVSTREFRVGCLGGRRMIDRTSYQRGRCARAPPRPLPRPGSRTTLRNSRHDRPAAPAWAATVCRQSGRSLPGCRKFEDRGHWPLRRRGRILAVSHPASSRRHRFVGARCLSFLTSFAEGGPRRAPRFRLNYQRIAIEVSIPPVRVGRWERFRDGGWWPHRRGSGTSCRICCQPRRHAGESLMSE